MATEIKMILLSRAHNKILYGKPQKTCMSTEQRVQWATKVNVRIITNPFVTRSGPNSSG